MDQGDVVTIIVTGRRYSAKLTPSGNIIVGANDHVDIKEDELAAYLWLGNHGLRRGKIKALLDAAIRKEGPYAI